MNTFETRASVPDALIRRHRSWLCELTADALKVAPGWTGSDQDIRRTVAERLMFLKWLVNQGVLTS